MNTTNTTTPTSQNRTVVPSPYYPQPQSGYSAYVPNDFFPTSGYWSGQSRLPPSYLELLLKRIWELKRLTLLWFVVTALVAALVYFLLGKPLWRAEGRLLYKPNYAVLDPLYRSANVQTAVEIVKSGDPSGESLPEVLRKQFALTDSPETILSRLKVDLKGQSEYIIVSFDHHDPKTAEAVANYVLRNGLIHMSRARDRELGLRASLTEKHKRELIEERNRTEKQYRETLEKQGIKDLEGDISLINSEILRLNGEYQTRFREIEAAKVAIKFLMKEKDNDNGNQSDDDDRMYQQYFALRQQFSATQAEEQQYRQALILQRSLLQQVESMRPAVEKGAITRTEYLKVLSDLQVAENTITLYEKNKKIAEDLDKKLEELKSNTKKGGAKNRQIEMRILEEQTKIKTYSESLEQTKTDLNAKEKERDKLIQLRNDLKGLKEKEESLRIQINALETTIGRQTGDASPYNAELTITDEAKVGSKPHSSSGPKLALAVFGISTLLFVAYLIMFQMPRGDTYGFGESMVQPTGPADRSPPSNHSTPHAEFYPLPRLTHTEIQIETPQPQIGPIAEMTTPSIGPLPPEQASSVSLVPVAQKTDSLPSLEFDAISGLAMRIAEAIQDRGAIVLFTPLASGLRINPLIGGLGRYFSQRGKILVFDARPIQGLPPGWAGPEAPLIASKVERFLQGRTTDLKACTISTSQVNLDYTRAELGALLNGQMAIHRFRQLVDHIREQYAMTLLVAPPIDPNTKEESFLTAVAEGQVLVAPQTLALDKLNQIMIEQSKGMTPIIGTVTSRLENPS